MFYTGGHLLYGSCTQQSLVGMFLTLMCIIETNIIIGSYCCISHYVCFKLFKTVVYS